MTREEEIFNVAEFYAHTESPCETILKYEAINYEKI